MKGVFMKNIFCVLAGTVGLVASMSCVQAHVVLSEPHAIAGDRKSTRLNSSH